MLRGISICGGLPGENQGADWKTCDPGEFPGNANLLIRPMIRAKRLVAEEPKDVRLADIRACFDALSQKAFGESL